MTVVGAVYGQRRGGFYGVRRPGPDSFKGSFTFCRLAVRGAAWAVDYPRADENLMIRVSELTKTPVNFDEAGTPHYVVITATDDALFQCPFIMLTDPAQAFVSDAEAAALRAYLQKGGFLWSDDFWGRYEWDHWVRELRKILPEEKYPLVDLPIRHPMFHTLFNGQRIPQIPNIGFCTEMFQAGSEFGRRRCRRSIRSQNTGEGFRLPLSH